MDAHVPKKEKREAWEKWFTSLPRLTQERVIALLELYVASNSSPELDLEVARKASKLSEEEFVYIMDTVIGRERLLAKGFLRWAVKSPSVAADAAAGHVRLAVASCALWEVNDYALRQGIVHAIKSGDSSVRGLLWQSYLRKFEWLRRAGVVVGWNFLGALLVEFGDEALVAGRIMKAYGHSGIEKVASMLSLYGGADLALEIAAELGWDIVPFNGAGEFSEAVEQILYGMDSARMEHIGGDEILATGWDHMIQLWDACNGKKSSPMRVQHAKVTAIYVMEPGSVVVLGGRSGLVSSFNLDFEDEEEGIGSCGGSVNSLGMIGDSVLIAGSSEQKIHGWLKRNDSRGWVALEAFSTNTMLSGLVGLPNRDDGALRVATYHLKVGSEATTGIAVYNLKTGKRESNIADGFSHSPKGLVVLDDGRLVSAGGATLKSWRWSPSGLLRRASWVETDVFQLSLSGDGWQSSIAGLRSQGGFVYAIVASHSVYCWDFNTTPASLVGVVEAPFPPIVSITPLSGRRVAAKVSHAVATIVDFEHSKSDETEYEGCVAVLADGRVVVPMAQGKKIGIWRSERWQSPKLETVLSSTRAVTGLIATDIGFIAVVGDRLHSYVMSKKDDGTVWTMTVEFKGAQEELSGAVFAASQSKVIGHGPHTLIVWDASTGEVLFKSLNSAVHGVMAIDGQAFVFGGSNTIQDGFKELNLVSLEVVQSRVPRPSFRGFSYEFMLLGMWNTETQGVVSLWDLGPTHVGVWDGKHGRELQRRYGNPNVVGVHDSRMFVLKKGNDSVEFWDWSKEESQEWTTTVAYVDHGAVGGHWDAIRKRLTVVRKSRPFVQFDV